MVPRGVCRLCWCHPRASLLFLDLTKGISPHMMQTPRATFRHRGVQSPRQVGLNISLLFLSYPLFPNDIHGFLKEILPSGKNFLDSGPYSMPRDYSNTIYVVTYCLHVLSHLASEIIQLHEHFCYLTLQMRKQTQRLQRALLKVTELV